MQKFLLPIILLISLSCKSINKDKKEVIASTTKIIALNEKPEKSIEIVFCLDATGSMSGLIGTAKEKIWDIVSEMAQSNDIDQLKLGMIFYRDRGDLFVTKQIQLTNDLDEVYSKLLEIDALGGGDTPESVNQALNEAVSEIEWSMDKNVYKTIFVVGDCPPHMDYTDDVKYTFSCKKAVEKGITINTIKLGNSCAKAIPHFKAMASCSNGEFLHLDQHAKDVIVETPYDDEINEVSQSIDKSRLYYGTKKEKDINNLKKEKSLEVYEKSSKTANSSRAFYKISKAGKKALGNKELVNDYINNKVEIEEIDENELPDDFKGKTKEEIKTMLKNLKEKRSQNEQKLRELAEKRKQFIKDKKDQMSETEKESFSEKVVDVLKQQAEKNNK